MSDHHSHTLNREHFNKHTRCYNFKACALGHFAEFAVRAEKGLLIAETERGRLAIRRRASAAVCVPTPCGDHSGLLPFACVYSVTEALLESLLEALLERRPSSSEFLYIAERLEAIGLSTYQDYLPKVYA